MYKLKELLNPNVVVFIENAEEWKRLKDTGLFNMTPQFYGAYCYSLSEGNYCRKSSKKDAGTYTTYLGGGPVDITIIKFKRIDFNETDNNMKNKIIIEGKEFDLPDELVNRIKEELSKSKKITYSDVYKKLFGSEKEGVPPIAPYPYYHPGNAYCTSFQQKLKLEAINKLMNVSKYLNKDWKKNTTGYNIYLDFGDNKIQIGTHSTIIASVVYFKTRDLAQEAISILGEDTIKLALSTDW